MWEILDTTRKKLAMYRFEADRHISARRVTGRRRNYQSTVVQR